MSDTPSYLPKSRSFFRQFLAAHFKDIFDTMRNSRVGANTGYQRYYRDGEVTDHMRSIALNLRDRFGNVTIPEEFTSGKQLIIAWNNYYEYLKKSDIMMEEVRDKYKDDPEQLPFPFWDVYETHKQILDLMEEIINMDEVKQSGSTEKAIVEDSLNDENIDVAIITALYDTEFEAVKRLPCNFRNYPVPDDATNYYIGKIDKKVVLIATDDKMGIAASAYLTTKIIAKFSPKYVIMAGIAAGVKDEEKNFGDIMVARWTFNYESGKYKFDKKTGVTKFEPNPEQIELDNRIVPIINDMKTDRIMLKVIKDGFLPEDGQLKPDNRLKVWFGPIASGSAVVADGKKIESIRTYHRKLIGLDMETYGVYHAAKYFSVSGSTIGISIKSISDFADEVKNDKYREYAAFTSANFIYELIRTKL